jgi:hypothetical protein
MTAQTCRIALLPYASALVLLQWATALNKPLQETDPELFDIIGMCNVTSADSDTTHNAKILRAPD